MFKISSRSQMKNRGAKAARALQNPNGSARGEASDVMSPSGGRMGSSQMSGSHKDIPTPKASRGQVEAEGVQKGRGKAVLPADEAMRSQSHQIKLNDGTEELQVDDEDSEPERNKSQMIDRLLLAGDHNTTGKRARKFTQRSAAPSGYDDESGIENEIAENELLEIQRVKKQNEQQ